MRDDDVDREAPHVVIGATAAAAVPLPILAVYAVTFIVHGGFHPVMPPDITNSQRGELAAGIVALVLFLISFVVLLWMLNGVRRWPFLIVQVLTLAGAVDLVLDSTLGGGALAFLLLAAAVIALVLALTPPAGAYVRPEGRASLLRRRREPAPTGGSVAG